MKKENKNKEKTNGFNKSFKLIAIGVLAGLIISVLLVFAGYKWIPDSRIKRIPKLSKFEQEITIDYVSKKLENISELATAEMTYNGLLTVTEGNIPFITKKGFSMIYTASVKAGIDASLIKTELTDETIIVNLPPAEIQMSWVDPDSIQFYDEKHALFNWSEKTDVTQAISTASNDVKENADIDSLLDKASKQAELLVKALLEGSAVNRKILVIHGNTLKSE